MRPWADPAAPVWAALLCAGLALWTAGTRDDVRSRTRRLVGAPGPQRAGSPLERLRDAVAELRSAGRGRSAGQRGAAGRAGRWPAHLLGHLLVRWHVRRPGGPGRWTGPELLCLPVAVALAVVTRSVLPVIAGPAAVPLVGRVLRTRRERAAAERAALAVGALCGTVAGDLRTGRPAHAALADAVAAAGWPESAELRDAGRLLLSAARFGGDVPQALRAAAGLQEGLAGLAAVGACWQVAVDGGAGLAAALDRVAAALRAEADQRADLRAQLAGPRSTAVLLALLPAFGLALGAGLGADPAAVLLHTPAGLACLLAGGLLEWAGLAWTARIIRAAEGGPAPKRAAADAVRRGPS
jgi:Flp pilus assembly protein TadB